VSSGGSVAGDAVSERGSLRRTSRGGALAVASFGALLAFLDATIVNVVFPDIRTSFPGSSIGGLSWVLNAYNIVFAAFLVAAGRLADVFGRRRTFSSGVWLFTLASIACAAAPSLGFLVGARAVQAAGAALLVPASLGLVVEAFPGERRSHAVGLWSATAAVAAGLGPPLGGALVAAESWRLAFLINLPLGLVAVGATRRLLVESRAPGRRTLPDLRGAALQGAALALLTLGVVEGGSWGWASPGVLASFAGAAVAGALFVASSRRHPSPVLDPALLRIRAFAVANAVTLVAGIGFYAYLLNNILWLHYVWGWSLLRSGLAVAPAAVVAALVAGGLGRVADERGHRLIAVPGAVVWAGAYVWYATQVGSSPHFLTEWLPGQVLSGLGVGATLPVLGSAALAAVPGGRFATASAVSASARQLGGVLGVSLLVVLIGTSASAGLDTRIKHGWLFSAACFAAAAVGALLLGSGRADVVEDDGAVLAPVLEEAPEPFAVAPAAAPESLLDRLPDGLRERLLAAGEPRTLAAGEWLFHEGDPADALYLLTAGRLEVESGGQRLAEVGAGAFVGELGLLAGTPRGAGVRARRDSRLLRVSGEAFLELLEEDRTLGRTVLARLAVQLQQSRAREPVAPSGPRVVSVVGHGDVPLERVAALLADGLRGRLRVAAPGRVDAAGLDRLERESDRVLLVAGEDDDEAWREFCVRQADRLLVVAPADAEPPLGAADRACDVLLVGAAPGRERLVGWHDALAPGRVLVTEQDDLPAAVETVAAGLAGRSLGVVLAGGGARSLAAIGVLEELERAGIRVDRLAGASVGAVVAALYATGLDAAELDATCYDEFVRRNPLGDYTLPRFALSRGRRLDTALVRTLGDVHFEELPRRLAVVSTDLVRRTRVVHRRGRVRDAVRASVSLPGLVPPARLGPELHVDGGLLDNLPVDALAPEDGPILAVNIAAGSSLGRREGPPRMPALPELLLRSLLIGGAGSHVAARRQATLVVTPDTRGIGLLEFHQLDRAIDAGRAAGAAAAEALLRAEAAAPTKGK
jgi:EmrB/QacA subfamily drug resistance transporter